MDYKEEIMDFLLIATALINRKQYFNYHKFTRFGLINFRVSIEIYKGGRSKELLKHFPIQNYIHHLSGGTRALYGDCEDIVEGFTGSKGHMDTELE